ncbi:MAG: YaiO family outer membrane beta-barrel protein [Mangrovibacterium sp.]
MNKRLFFTLLLLCLAVFGQQKAIAQVKINADSLFLVARQHAFDGSYKKALQITEQILIQNPDYYDVALLECRINAWQGNYEVAEPIATSVIKRDPRNYDAYDALSSIYLWNNQNEECILTINRALYFFENDITLLIKKTKALLALKNYEEAQEVVDILLDLDPENTEIKKLSGRVQMESAHEVPINSDSLFIVARTKAANSDFMGARQLANEVLETFPNYTDAQILIARTYAWEEKYDLAHKELDKVLVAESKNYDAIALKTDLYFWEGQYHNCLDAINKALDTYAKDIPLLTKKFKVQVAMKDSRAADETLKLLETLDPENKSIKDEKKKISLSKPYHNIIRVEYDYETFSTPWKRMWTMTGLSYGRHTDKYGDYYANLFMGDLILPGEAFGEDLGYQLELECYPKIDDQNSLFLAYAYSPSTVFSTHRLGAEYYRSFPDILEASIGYRFMNFSNTEENPVDVNIFTASVAKYLGNYWLSFRPYGIWVSNEEQLKATYQLIGRRYLERPESFIGLTLGYGISSPDDNFFQNNAGAVPLYQTFNAQAQCKYKISQTLLVDSYLGYENAEYEAGLHRGQITFRIAVSCLF